MADTTLVDFFSWYFNGHLIGKETHFCEQPLSLPNKETADQIDLLYYAYTNQNRPGVTGYALLLTFANQDKACTFETGAYFDANKIMARLYTDGIYPYTSGTYPTAAARWRKEFTLPLDIIKAQAAVDLFEKSATLFQYPAAPVPTRKIILPERSFSPLSMALG